MTGNTAQHIEGKRAYLYIGVSVGILLLLLYYAVQIQRDRNSGNFDSFACQSFGQPTFDALPGEIQEFHYALQNSTVAEVAKITWFSCPYPEFYYALVFYVDKTVTHWREVPNWATQGGAAGKLTVENYVQLVELLSELGENGIPVSEGKGDYLIVLSFHDADDIPRKLICAERDCPQEIKGLFDLTDGTFQTGNGFMVGTPFSHIDGR